MGSRVRRMVAVAVAGLFLYGGAQALQAAAAPSIHSATLGKDASSGRPVLTLTGTSLTKLKSISLGDSNMVGLEGTVEVLARSKSTLVLLLPPVPGGEYHLLADSGASVPFAFPLPIDSGAVFGGTFGAGTIPAEGAGTRMMWYPGKGAFRAGGADANQPWDDLNVGDFSAATGSSTVASGDYSTASGFYTTAGGLRSFATGFYSNAGGVAAFAAGQNTVASGYGSTALGESTAAVGNYSTATGFTTTAGGYVSSAMGEYTTAQAYGSLALGRHNVVAGNPNIIVATDPVLVVGNGDSPMATSNAFTLLRNGNLTIAGTLTQASDLRMKRDVHALTGVLSRIAGIRGVSYEFRDPTRSPEGRQIGLVAQEVRAAFPELVREDAQGNLSVSYQNFAAVLLEAVKEQQAELQARDREVEALRRRLEATDERLARLEALLQGGGAPAKGK